MDEAILTDDEGTSLHGRCSYCQRRVDNHDEQHRVSEIMRGGRGVECAVRGDIHGHEAMPLGRRPAVAAMHPDEHAQLASLMADCGRAMYDDRRWTAPVYDAYGEVVGGNRVNPDEAATALNAVAVILGLDGPSVIYDRLCEDEDY